MITLLSHLEVCLKFNLICLIIFISGLSWSNPQFKNIEIKNCEKEKQTENFIYRNDFKWGYTIPQIFSLFDNMYISDKKLQQRAYADPSSNIIKLPYSSDQGGDIPLPAAFVQNVLTKQNATLAWQAEA